MRNIWMDCDPGIDDSVTLCLIKASKDLKLCGISTVAGNQTSDRVTENARRLAGLLGFDCPVIRGVRKPLIQKMEIADYVHGPTGLGQCVLPDSDKEVLEGNPIELMYENIMAVEGKVTLVLTGPLTNGALLFTLHPEVMDKLDEIVIMGGGSVIGNKTQMVEFNIGTDPEAAKIVFDTPANKTLVSLDVTNFCGISGTMINSLANSEKEIQKYVGDMLKFYATCATNFYGDLYNIHDASTLVYLTNPEVFTYQMVTCDVDTNQGVNRGMTICDKRVGRDLSTCNVKLLSSVNNDLWMKVVYDKLSSL